MKHYESVYEYTSSELEEIIKSYYNLKEKEILNDSEIRDFEIKGRILLHLIEHRDLDAEDFPFYSGKLNALHTSMNKLINNYALAMMDQEMIDFLQQYKNLRESKVKEYHKGNKLARIDYKFMEVLYSHIYREYKDIVMKAAPKNSEETLVKIKEIEDELNIKIEEELKDYPRMLGFIHVWWGTKRRILKDDYGIDWFPPSECNPYNRYD